MDAVPDDLPPPLPPSGLFGATPPTQGRDRGAYAALVSILEATGAFQEVIFGDATHRSRAGASGYPLAVVTPKGWEELDETDPTLLVRRSSFAITVVVKSEEGGPEIDALDFIATAIQDAVDGSDLGGTSLGALTRIDSGRYGPATHYPEQSIELAGSFTKLIQPPAPTNA